MTVAIRLSEVSKSYKLGEAQGSLRDAVNAWVGRIIHRRQTHARDAREEMWALKDVTFNVEQGEIVGLIGANGAGKTTTLKLLTGVTKPTMGQITVNGRIGSLIELGAGFHPDLTGRENIYLNGTILGLKRAEIEQLFDSIVAFSGLESWGVKTGKTE
jgi:lipopolysaccharide transport system ATP-binding protein